MINNLYLRRATQEDVDLLFNWVNDKSVRDNAFDTHIISFFEHKTWFDSLLQDDGQIQYILMKNEKPIGQIRLRIDGYRAEIDYSISKDERGYGYGKEIIRLAIAKIQSDYPDVKKLIGKVKPSNVASFLCFIENGFEEKYHYLELCLNGFDE